MNDVLQVYCLALKPLIDDSNCGERVLGFNILIAVISTKHNQIIKLYK